MSRRLGTQFVEQRLCVFEVGGIEAFGEPAVDRREQVVRFGAATLVAAEPSEARGGAQFPEFGLLLAGNAQSLLTELLACLGVPLPQQQLAFVPIQLRCEPPFSCPIHHLQRLVQRAQGLFSLSCDITGAGQEGAELGHPCLGLGGAESARTLPKQRYPLRHIAILDLCPSTPDRALCTPARETLLRRQRDQLVCPLTENCAVSAARKQPGANRQARSQRGRMTQSFSLSDGCC